MLFITLNDLIFHRKLIFGIDGTVFGYQVADMAIGRQDIKVLAQILADGAGLGGRLNYYEVL